MRTCGVGGPRSTGWIAALSLISLSNDQRRWISDWWSEAISALCDPERPKGTRSESPLRFAPGPRLWRDHLRAGALRHLFRLWGSLKAKTAGRGRPAEDRKETKLARRA